MDGFKEIKNAIKFNVLLLLLILILVFTLFFLIPMKSDVENIFKKELGGGSVEISLSQVEDSISYVLENMGCKKRRCGVYARAIHESCSDFNLDWRWVVAQIRRESFFKPYVRSIVSTQFAGDVSSEHAYGLFQIKPSTAAEIADNLGEIYHKNLLFDSATNIRWGCYYFARRLLVHKQDVEKAVRAYNAGDGGLRMGLSSDSHWQAVSDNYALINTIFDRGGYDRARQR